MLPFYYYCKAAFCYRLPKNHLISGELITCQTVGMLFVFFTLHCWVSSFFVLCLCFVFILYLRGRFGIGTYTKVTKPTSFPFLFLHYKKRCSSCEALKKKKGTNESSTSRHQLFLKRILKGSSRTLSRCTDRSISQVVGIGRESKFIFIYSYLITKNCICNESSRKYISNCRKSLYYACALCITFRVYDTVQDKYN